jgi:hypothetical protein
MRSWLTGTDIETVLRERQLRVDPSTTLDIDVSLGSGDNAIPVRLAGVPTEDKGSLLFLTNLPRSTHSPDDVSTLYRLRWTIELDNKLNKCAFRLDKVTAQSPVSVRILVLAALIASVIANAFAYQDHVNRGYVGDQSPPLTESPIHPMLVAKAIATSADTLAATVANPEAPLKSWANMASAIRHLSLDPKWGIAQRFGQSQRPCRPARPPSTLQFGVRADGGRRSVISNSPGGLLRRLFRLPAPPPALPGARPACGPPRPADQSPARLGAQSPAGSAGATRRGDRRRPAGGPREGAPGAGDRPLRPRGPPSGAARAAGLDRAPG